MLALLELVDVTQLLIWLIGITATGILVFYRKTIKSWKTAFSEITTGLKNIPILEDRVNVLNESVDIIRKQVLPNGGSSISDAIGRAESAIGLVNDNMNLLAATITAENDVDDEIGRFYFNPDGEITYVNQLYARWIGVGKSELMGRQFLNFVHHEDVEQVRHLLDISRAEIRLYRNVHRMVTVSGDVFRVKVIATPVPENSPILRWVGVIWKLGNDG